jgi:ATP/maltotriose-dependent transcriptional regulator MalT
MCPQSSAGHANDRKTTIPLVTAAAVERAKLTEKLSSDAALIMVSGVPGTGRTTLVSDWARAQRELGLTVEWLDQHSKFRKPFELFTAISNRLGPSRKGGRFEGTVEGVIENLVGALRREPSRVIVILDDADGYLTDDHMNVIEQITSRTNMVSFVVIGHALPTPPAAISLIELKSKDLFLSAAELATMATSAGITATPEQIERTHAAFQGWLTPSLIALRSLHDSEERNRTAEVAWGLATDLVQRYLQTTVARPLENDVLLPLWQWDFADELSIETLTVVLDDGLAHTVVSRLEDEGAVETIPGSHPQRWRKNLGQAIGSLLFSEYDRKHPALRTATHQRLAAWHLAEGRPADALVHATTAEDWPAVDSIIMVDWALLVSTAKDSLRDALNAMPEDFIRANPRWLEAKTFMNFLPAEGRTRPTSFRQSTRLPPTNLLDLLASLTGRSATMRFMGDFAGAVDLAREAEEALADTTAEARATVETVLPDLRLQWSIAQLLAGYRSMALASYTETYDDAVRYGNHRIAVEAAGSIALIHAYDGWTEAAHIWLSRVPDYADDGTDTVHTNIYLARAMLALNALDLTEADRILTDEVALDRAPEQIAFIAYLQAQLSSFRGEASAALATLSMSRSSTGAMWDSGMNSLLVTVAEAELLIASGQAPLATVLLDDTALTHDDSWTRFTIEALSARASLYSGNLTRAADLAFSGGRAAVGPARSSAELLLLASIVALIEGDPDTAQTHFANCIDIVTTHSLVSVLARAPHKQLFALFELTPNTANAALKLAVSGVRPRELPRQELPKLTARERQILRQLVDGSSPEEIAQANFVTRGTLKSQLRSLYRKLGTHNRQETITAARSIPGL